MACGATLKRLREFDPLQSSPDLSPKRICLPVADLMSPSPSTAAAAGVGTHCGGPGSSARLQQFSGSAFVEAAQKLIHDKLAARMSPSREKQMVDSNISPMRSSSCSMSPVANPSWVTDQLPVASEPWHGNGSKTTASTHASGRKEQLFTMKQVEMICRNVLKEHEEKVREEFDNILANKLAEQYEGLLSFNQTQIHNKFDKSDASYVS